MLAFALLILIGISGWVGYKLGQQSRDREAWRRGLIDRSIYERGLKPEDME